MRLYKITKIIESRGLSLVDGKNKSITSTKETEEYLMCPDSLDAIEYYKEELPTLQLWGDNIKDIRLQLISKYINSAGKINIFDNLLTLIGCSYTGTAGEPKRTSWFAKLSEEQLEEIAVILDDPDFAKWLYEKMKDKPPLKEKDEKDGTSK